MSDQFHQGALLGGWCRYFDTRSQLLRLVFLESDLGNFYFLYDRFNGLGAIENFHLVDFEGWNRQDDFFEI
jgi:hypothetical protein